MTAGFVVCFQFNQLSCFLGVAQQEVLAGKREQVFVSLAGSIATSFFFAVLTALTFVAARPLADIMTLELPVLVVLLAGVLNISAGLAVSLLVGGVILVLKKM